MFVSHFLWFTFWCQLEESLLKLQDGWHVSWPRWLYRLHRFVQAGSYFFEEIQYWKHLKTSKFFQILIRFKDFNLYATCIPVRKPVAWQESTTLTLSTAERSQQVSIGAFVVPRRMAARFHQSRLFVWMTTWVVSYFFFVFFVFPGKKQKTVERVLCFFGISHHEEKPLHRCLRHLWRNCWSPNGTRRTRRTRRLFRCRCRRPSRCLTASTVRPARISCCEASRFSTRWRFVVPRSWCKFKRKVVSTWWRWMVFPRLRPWWRFLKICRASSLSRQDVFGQSRGRRVN